MTVDLSGPVSVQARILAIQDRFAPAPATSGAAASSTAASSTVSAVTGQADASSFAAALARLAPDASATGADQSAGTAFGTGMDALAGTTALAGAGSPGPAGAPGATGGAQAVAAACRYLGVPYAWGGTDPATGLDCSGLVQRAYADLGVQLPRVASDQARCGQPVASLADAKPGDLLAFGSPVDHIGIYAGGDSMVVAPKTGDVVKIERIYTTPTAIRRILPDATDSLAGTSGPGGASAGRALAAAPAAYRPLFTAAAQRYGVPVDLLAAVAHTESGFDASAVSGAGALGLMQLMPGTARSLGVDPLDPAQAVDGAARMLAANLRKYGSTALALAAYNAGPGAVDRFGGIPPYRETRDYVTRVLANEKGVSA